MSLPSHTTGRQRLRIIVHGAVQGVGFRPFVYRLAVERQLDGWVTNTPQGVVIEAEGDPQCLDGLQQEICARKPAVAQIHSLESVLLAPVGHRGFEIRESDHSGPNIAVVLPDLATCPDCLREIFDPADRRYRYPFTNCTNCGPRFTIISALPYDRPNTSMRMFSQCPECRREYDNPGDRRFHAQPNACPACGPRVRLWNPAGETLAANWPAIEHAAELIRGGKIVAVKDVGGFHLVCNALEGSVVRALRSRKRREEKPFALLMPSLAVSRRFAELSSLDEQTLTSSAAPIVLVRRTLASRELDEAVAAENPFLGIMLPSNPLQHLLMDLLGAPVVATSGNLSDEPICIEQHEALDRLHGIADAFLIHDRPILRHADDSIVRVMLGRELVMRRARGFAPLPMLTDLTLRPALAVGAHLKNAVAVAAGHRIVLGQHIGDLETVESVEAFEKAVGDLPELHGIRPEHVVRDLHPDYRSSQHAGSTGLPVVEIQHHVAHLAACMAENGVHPPVLGISWDGTGLGTDATIWGGEFIRIDDEGWRRVATLRPFRLPGGDAAVREPRRTALSVLLGSIGPEVLSQSDLPTIAAFTPEERQVLHDMLECGVRSPITTSAGRLFDAIASIVGLRHHVRHEGQAAMELEWAALGSEHAGCYALPIVNEGDVLVIDWRPMVRAVVKDVRRSMPVGDIARQFHETLVDGMIAVAKAIGIRTVVLSGGCFQNALLTLLAVERLREAGFDAVWHQRIPPNDGGIAVGQLMAAAMGLTVQRHLSPLETTA